MRRRLVVPLGLACAALVLAACGGSGEATVTGNDPAAHALEGKAATGDRAESKQGEAERRQQRHDEVRGTSDEPRTKPNGSGEGDNPNPEKPKPQAETTAGQDPKPARNTAPGCPPQLTRGQCELAAQSPGSGTSETTVSCPPSIGAKQCRELEQALSEAESGGSGSTECPPALTLAQCEEAVRAGEG